ncbi:MAG: hypothetical protein ACMXYA_02695, partial [Candidatus Woesearchaeota archaeon]
MKYIFLILPLILAFQFAPSHIELHTVEDHPQKVPYMSTESVNISSLCPFLDVQHESDSLILTQIEPLSYSYITCNLQIQSSLIDVLIPVTVHARNYTEPSFFITGKMTWDGMQSIIHLNIQNTKPVSASLSIQPFNDTFFVYGNEERTKTYTTTEYLKTIRYCVHPCQNHTNLALSITERIQKPELRVSIQNRTDSYIILALQTPDFPFVIDI